jgi:glycosyltransferase involved in cell wall biosynthesis
MRHDVADILAALDAYAKPSLWEGLSLALLEAMAARLPFIASDVGGVSQVLGDHVFGIKLPPGDAPALAAAIRSLQDTPSERRAAMGEQARRRVEADFSLGAMMGKLQEIYCDVLAQA